MSNRKSLGNTFTEEEIKMAVFLIHTINRGGDPCMARKHAAWTSFSRKFLGMSERIANGSAPESTSTLERQRYLDQGYTEKEVDQIMALNGA